MAWHWLSAPLTTEPRQIWLKRNLICMVKMVMLMTMTMVTMTTTRLLVEIADTSLLQFFLKNLLTLLFTTNFV